MIRSSAFALLGISCHSPDRNCSSAADEASGRLHSIEPSTRAGIDD